MPLIIELETMTPRGSHFLRENENMGKNIWTPDLHTDKNIHSHHQKTVLRSSQF